jgi:hypothetical protein
MEFNEGILNGVSIDEIPGATAALELIHTRATTGVGDEFAQKLSELKATLSPSDFDSMITWLVAYGFAHTLLCLMFSGRDPSQAAAYIEHQQGGIRDLAVQLAQRAEGQS